MSIVMELIENNDVYAMHLSALLHPTLCMNGTLVVFLINFLIVPFRWIGNYTTTTTSI